MKRRRVGEKREFKWRKYNFCFNALSFPITMNKPLLLMGKEAKIKRTYNKLEPTEILKLINK